MGIPAQDEDEVCANVGSRKKRAARGSSGPTCPGILSRERPNVGIIPARSSARGKRRRRLALGGTLTTRSATSVPRGFWQLGDRRRIGGDPVPPGIGIHRHWPFEDDPRRAESDVRRDGGDAEEGPQVASSPDVTKPVVALHAGSRRRARPGPTGALVSGAGNRHGQAEALERQGIAR